MGSYRGKATVRAHFSINLPSPVQGEGQGVGEL